MRRSAFMASPRSKKVLLSSPLIAPLAPLPFLFNPFHAGQRLLAFQALDLLRWRVPAGKVDQRRHGAALALFSV